MRREAGQRPPQNPDSISSANGPGPATIGLMTNDEWLMTPLTSPHLSPLPGIGK